MSATVTKQVHFGVSDRGRRVLRMGVRAEAPSDARGRVPRVARLMALAIKFDRLLGDGAITDQAELARIGHVTRARVTQIMNLLHLAPDIQETILFLPPVTEGRDPITERDLRPIAAEIDWRRQRWAWKSIYR
ncbi:MAG: hypothetical protein H6813_02740 [Phycisphaeraceae bacterium]|nr:hypothetical protein [Phycisphaeraceae bacterium]MCB9848766.1 hypothetical protein [Phycisphaeraceae bacterium]